MDIWNARSLTIPPIILGIYEKYKVKTRKNFSKYIKDICLKDILTCFENLKYKEQEIPSGLLTESDLFSCFDRTTKDDVYTGKYQDIWFHAEEIKLISSSSISFQGIVIVFPTNKTIKSKTIVTSKTDNNKNNKVHYASFFFVTLGLLISIFIMSGLISQGGILAGFGFIFQTVIFGALLISYLLNNFANSKKYEKVKLEDVGFEKRFTVQSKDQIESRYLVTPTFMERLYQLQTVYGTKNIKCSFFDNKVMFAISTSRDLFEIGDLYKPLTDSTQISQFMKELTTIYDLIDYFKLNENTKL